MAWPTLVAIAFFVLIVIAAVLRRSAGGQSNGLPYTLKPALFSPAERSFLGVLDQAVGKHYRIFGKVRIADVVETERGLNASTRQSALNRVVAKHFDFVLCDIQDLSVVCAIELDDKSHRRKSRQQRDSFVADLCGRVGLPLVRIAAKRAYAVQELRTIILDATQRRLEPSFSVDAAI